MGAGLMGAGLRAGTLPAKAPHPVTVCYGGCMAFAITAWVLLALGATLEVWALLALGWRRALNLAAPADPGMPRLVFGGPFGFVRHPQALGLLLILAGAAVGSHNAAVWLVTACAGALVVAMAMRHDRQMARHCGEAYARYQRGIPLLWPRLR